MKYFFYIFDLFMFIFINDSVVCATIAGLFRHYFQHELVLIRSTRTATIVVVVVVVTVAIVATVVVIE